LAAYYANGGRAEGLGRDIYAKDPMKIEKEIAELAAKAQGNPWQADTQPRRYGLASLEYGWTSPASACDVLWRNGGMGTRTG